MSDIVEGILTMHDTTKVIDVASIIESYFHHFHVVDIVLFGKFYFDQSFFSLRLAGVTNTDIILVTDASIADGPLDPGGLPDLECKECPCQ